MENNSYFISIKDKLVELDYIKERVDQLIRVVESDKELVDDLINDKKISNSTFV